MRLARRVVARHLKTGAKVQVHLRYTQFYRERFSQPHMVVGRIQGTLPLFRIVDGEELRKILSSGKITGGDYSIEAERTFGASWGGDRNAIVKWGDSSRGGRLGHELFLLEIDGKGKSFAILGSPVFKDLPPAPEDKDAPPEEYLYETDLPVGECNTGHGCSVKASVKDVKNWWVVEEGGNLVKTTPAKLKDMVASLGQKPRLLDIYRGTTLKRNLAEWADYTLRMRRRDRAAAARRPAKDWQAKFIKALGPEGWTTSMAKAEAEAGRSTNPKSISVVFQATANATAPDHMVEGLTELTLQMVHVYDPETSRWEQLWRDRVVVRF